MKSQTKQNVSFYDELFSFLQEDLLKKKREEGWEERNDPEVMRYSDLLSQTIRSPVLYSLEELMDRYHFLFGERGPIHLEQKLSATFPDAVMQRFSLPLFRIYRGLPRMHQKEHPGIAKIEPHFSHLPSLKRLLAHRFVSYLYANIGIPKNAKVALFTWVMNDGLGDYYALIETCSLLSRALPEVTFFPFVVSEKPLPSADFPVTAWVGSPEQNELLQSCLAVLQMPTYDPSIQETRKSIDPKKWTDIGQYGFVQSRDFHPQSGAFSMGLHFLELGVLTREKESFPSALSLGHIKLKNTLFNGEVDVAQYRQNRRFFLAYLYSREGIFVYLHALLQSLEKDVKDIDVCIPDAQKVVSYFEWRLSLNAPLIEGDFHLKEIIFQDDVHLARYSLQSQGKTLRILSFSEISSSDFQCLLDLSENFVACRGDQSFSDVISKNRCFFYDPRDHSRYFMKDLIALAQNRISQYPMAIAMLRLYDSLLAYQLEEDAGEQDQRVPLLQIAMEMGQYLQNPQTFLGFRHLCEIISCDHSCNSFFIQWIKRQIVHDLDPDLAQKEEMAIFAFSSGTLSFESMMEKCQKELTKNEKGMNV